MSDTKSYRFLHTTEISAMRTAAEMVELLVKIGATNVVQEFDNSKLKGLAFQVNLGGSLAMYRLPINTENIFKVLLKEANRGRKRGLYGRMAEEREKKLREQAERTAWRLGLEWLKVQCAFVAHGVKSAPEVFLSDLIVKHPETGAVTTMGQLMLSGGFTKLLGGGNSNG